MNEMLKRTEMLIGTDGIEKLKNSHVAVFGLGGVGGICTEALARSGVGKLTIIDRGVVTPSNINRQIIATTATIGANKVDAMAERIRLISPSCEVNTIKTFFLMGDDGKVVFSDFDYIIDAVDVITAKLSIVELAKKANIPLVSVMGTGNRIDPTKVRVGELFETRYCPLCKFMRKKLRRRGITSVTAVYSEEQPTEPLDILFTDSGKSVPASMMFVPSAAGLAAASFVVRSLTKKDEPSQQYIPNQNSTTNKNQTNLSKQN